MGSASAHTASMHSKRMHSRYTQREHGGHKHDNASMHSASTKHGPVHPRDVDDVDEGMSHDLGESCTSAPHAQHEGAQLEHTPHGHAQQAWARSEVQLVAENWRVCTLGGTGLKKTQRFREARLAADGGRFRTRRWR